MSTLTAPVAKRSAPGQRPLAWRRMAWVTWRQHRFALTGLTVLLGAVALYLWAAGLDLHHAYTAAAGCHPADSPTCSNLASRFNDMNKVLQNGFVLQAVPAVIGAFIGAPLLARELESGTFRYAWTQGFGRSRWTLAKLVALVVIVTAAAAAFTLLISWYYQPYLATGNQALGLTQTSPLTGGLFDLRGVGFAAWTMTAFAIGAFAGMLTRRVVPAIVASLVAYAGLALVAGLFIRQHYLAPLLTSRVSVAASALVTGQYGTKGGHVAFTGRPPANLLFQYCPPSAVGPGKPTSGTLAQCLTKHGYTLWTHYQPASRFWTFQWIEGGWLLALSALIIGSTVWLVRRRAT
jgi:hypothetical protein